MSRASQVYQPNRMDQPAILWTHVYGTGRGVLSLFSGVRLEPGSKRLESIKQAYFVWPSEQERARVWIEHEAAVGRETYHCAHLLTARRRVKANAAPVFALWVDADDAEVIAGPFEPTAVIESSPGRTQLYCRLDQAIEPELAEGLNRRWAAAIGADKSGWDVTQLLRLPGTPNFKYADVPLVRILGLKDERHDPAELDRLLPPLPREETKATKSPRPEGAEPTPDLTQLSRKMRTLVRHGNRSQYPSRSEADIAACVAMFGAGYSEAQVWAVMTDPANRISEKFLEKNHHGERYLALTIGKARAVAGSSRARRRGVVRLGPPRAGAGVIREVVIRLG